MAVKSFFSRRLINYLELNFGQKISCAPSVDKFRGNTLMIRRQSLTLNNHFIKPHVLMVNSSVRNYAFEALLLFCPKAFSLDLLCFSSVVLFIG